MAEWFELGNYYDFLGESDKALEFFKKYQEGSPNNEMVLIKLERLGNLNKGNNA